MCSRLCAGTGMKATHTFPINHSALCPLQAWLLPHIPLLYYRLPLSTGLPHSPAPMATELRSLCPDSLEAGTLFPSFSPLQQGLSPQVPDSHQSPLGSDLTVPQGNLFPRPQASENCLWSNPRVNSVLISLRLSPWNTGNCMLFP